MCRLLSIAICVATTSSVCADDLDRTLDDYLRPAAEKREFTGVVLVAQNGKPIVRRAYGYADWLQKTPMTPETSGMLFSISKQFTAASIMLLQDRGKFHVNDKLSKHLADTPPEWADVTLHQLLCHTSGIEIDNLWRWIEIHYPHCRDVREPNPGPYERKPLESAPGKKYRYSNGGYILLAQVVAKVSGQTYPDFVRANILVPLKMSSSGIDANRPVPGRARGHTIAPNSIVITEQDTNYVQGAGDAYATVDDMLKWDEALYGDKLLSAHSRQAMFRPHATGPSGGGYGYAWVVRKDSRGREWFQHGGSGAGFSGIVVRWPHEHVYLIVVANRETDADYPYIKGCRERVQQWLDKQAPAKTP
jgi:CubicO group peptidase (beta-lactamase class C family)